MLRNSTRSYKASNEKPCNTSNEKSCEASNVKSCDASNGKTLITSNNKTRMTSNIKSCMTSKANKQAVNLNDTQLHVSNKRELETLVTTKTLALSNFQICVTCTAYTISCTHTPLSGKRPKTTPQLERATLYNYATFRMHKLASQPVIPFSSQPHAAAQIPTSVTTFLDRAQLNGVSMQPVLSTP